MEFYNVVGNIGVLVLMLAYFLLAKGVLKATGLLYYVLNILASVLILFSLIFAFNMPSFIVQTMFIFISVYGILKNIRTGKS